MRTIWKFDVDAGNFVVQLPEDARFLAVQTQRWEPEMWWEVDPAAKIVPEHFCTVCTGQEVPSDAAYLGTFQLTDGCLVFHLYWLKGNQRGTK